MHTRDTEQEMAQILLHLIMSADKSAKPPKGNPPAKADLPKSKKKFLRLAASNLDTNMTQLLETLFGLILTDKKSAAKPNPPIPQR